jgi:hypothetical protein
VVAFLNLGLVRLYQYSGGLKSNEACLIVPVSSGLKACLVVPVSSGLKRNEPN